MIFFFFFFKQKTAYEMRISDWSSDVCSSDLMSKMAVVISIAIFPIVIGTVLGLRSIDPDLINMAKAMRAPHKQILWKLRFPQALPSLLSGMKEIGRASCRERVCQYV